MNTCPNVNTCSTSPAKPANPVVELIEAVKADVAAYDEDLSFCQKNGYRDRAAGIERHYGPRMDRLRAAVAALDSAGWNDDLHFDKNKWKQFRAMGRAITRLFGYLNHRRSESVYSTDVRNCFKELHGHFTQIAFMDYDFTEPLTSAQAAEQQAAMHDRGTDAILEDLTKPFVAAKAEDIPQNCPEGEKVMNDLVAQVVNSSMRDFLVKLSREIDKGIKALASEVSVSPLGPRS